MWRVSVALFVASLVAAFGLYSALAEPDGPAEPRLDRAIPLPDRSVPVLTDADRAKAESIAYSGSWLPKLLEAGSAKTVDVAAWHSSTGTKLGAALTVSMSAPITGDFEFVVMNYDEDKYDQYYDAARYTAHVEEMDQLLVFVDTRLETIAAVNPSGAAKVAVIDDSNLRSKLGEIRGGGAR